MPTWSPGVNPSAHDALRFQLEGDFLEARWDLDTAVGLDLFRGDQPFGEELLARDEVHSS